MNIQTRLRIGYVLLILGLIILTALLAPRLQAALTIDDLDAPASFIVVTHLICFGLPLGLAVFFWATSLRPIMPPQFEDTLASVVAHRDQAVSTMGASHRAQMETALDQVRAACPSCRSPYTTLVTESARCPSCGVQIAAHQHLVVGRA